jgi:hypothetical protein
MTETDMPKRVRDLNHERNHRRTSAGAMRSRRRELEDRAMSMDEVADLLDHARPLEDRVAHMRELAERQAESHAALMLDEEDGEE